MQKEKMGFTLIELLVVVLIIGILAAVALPQYQKVVGKARMAELKTVVPTYLNAIHAAYLETGISNPSNDILSIDLPTSNYWDIYIGECIADKGKYGCEIDADGKNALNGVHIYYVEKEYYEADGNSSNPKSSVWECSGNNKKSNCPNLGFTKYDEERDVYLEP